MQLNVTFQQTEQSFRPSFDTVIPVETGAEKVQSLLDSTMAGTYEKDNITYLRMGAFAQCRDLTEVRLPACVEINGYRTFYECENIKTLHLPNLVTIAEGNYTFYGMQRLTEISLPSLTTIESNFAGTFWNCTDVTKIALPKLGGTTISNHAFRYCYKLDTLILGGAVLNPLGNTNAFHGTGTETAKPFAIYVPDHLVTQYKTATNWTAFAGKIKPLSELEE